MLDKVEMLERLTALWRAGTLSDAEFQHQKAELLGQMGAPAPSPKGWHAKPLLGSKIWIIGGALILGLALILIGPRLVSSNDLPSELAPAMEFAREGEPWSPVEKVPADFRGRYGPQGCSLGSQEVTETNQIMYWTGDPPKVLRTFSRIYVSGDRLLVDGSPNAITVYEKSPTGGLVMLKNWFADAKLPADKGPVENPACPGNRPAVADGQEAQASAPRAEGQTASAAVDDDELARLQSLGTCVMFQSWFTSSAGLSKLSRISPQLAGTMYERLPKMSQQVNAGTQTIGELMPGIDMRNASAAYTREMDAAGPQKVISAAQAAMDCTEWIDSEFGI